MVHKLFGQQIDKQTARDKNVQLRSKSTQVSNLKLLNLKVYCKELSSVSARFSDLQGGDDFIPLLVDSDGVSGVSLRINDRVSSLPADNDGLLASCCAVQLLGLALPSHGGVGVAGDHGRN